MTDGTFGNIGKDAGAVRARTGRLAALDPRLSLAAAIGWTIAVLMLLFAAITGLVTVRAAGQAIEREIGQLYAGHARRLIDTIDANLAGRRQWVAITGRLIALRGTGPSVDVGIVPPGMLDDLRNALPEIEWAGIASLNGRIVAATDGILVGHDVGSRPWFTKAFYEPTVSDVHSGVLLDRALPRLIEGEPRRFVDLSAPVLDSRGEVRAILGVALGWSWIEVLRRNAATLLAGRPAVEILLLGVDGTALLGSQDLPAGTRFDLSRFAGEGRSIVDGDYLVGVARSQGFGEFRGLGWTVIVREPVATAFAPAYRASASIFGLILLGGIASALAAAFAARGLTARLKRLASAADRLRLGLVETFEIQPGRDEAGRIGQSMEALVGTLQSANRDLNALNTELDARVAARAREIERLSHEARRVAVTRERLRISRDLHDTLAHSMLALLTQIRLIRKFTGGGRERFDREALEGELERAEIAAQEGLAQSREAVVNLRYSPVREDGFGAALARLGARVNQRQQVNVTVEVDEPAALLADERTEAVYRIVEEAMRNVELHAEAREVSIRARMGTLADMQHLEIAVVDDGIGFDTEAKREGRFGLLGIREQAEMIGARLEIRSAPGKGTELSVLMPVTG
jgi:signal transduction histidine kinase